MARNTSVTLGEHFEQFIASIIKEGRYQSTSEAVRAGLRKLEEDESKLDALRARLAAGENSAVVEDFNGEAFLGALHTKYGE